MPRCLSSEIQRLTLAALYPVFFAISDAKAPFGLAISPYALDILLDFLKLVFTKYIMFSFKLLFSFSFF